jgi:hypothetical protein
LHTLTGVYAKVCIHPLAIDGAAAKKHSFPSK